MLVKLVREECIEARPGRDLVLGRLVEVLLVEALRSHTRDSAPAGLLRGLADARVAVGLRLMHSAPARSWAVEALAKEAALAKTLLSRHGVAMTEVAEKVGYSSASTFSTAFSRHVGQPPSRNARHP